MGALVTYDARPLLARAVDLGTTWGWFGPDWLKTTFASEGTQLTLGLARRFRSPITRLGLQDEAFLAFGIVSFGLLLESRGSLDVATQILRARNLTALFRVGFTEISKFLGAIAHLKSYLGGAEIEIDWIPKFNLNLETASAELRFYQFAQLLSADPSQPWHGLKWYFEAKEYVQKIAARAVARKAILQHFHRELESHDMPEMVVATMLLSLAFSETNPQSPFPEMHLATLVRAICWHPKRFSGWYEEVLVPKLNSLRHKLPVEVLVDFDAFLQDLRDELTLACRVRSRSKAIEGLLLRLDISPTQMPEDGPSELAERLAKL